MDTPTIPTTEPAKIQVSLKKPLICFALPFILFLPTWWFLCRYVPDHARVSEKIGVEHMRMHWGVFWVITFFPFTAICFLSSLVMLFRRARHSPEAKVALIPVGLFVLGIFVLLFLIFTGR